MPASGWPSAAAGCRAMWPCSWTRPACPTVPSCRSTGPIALNGVWRARFSTGRWMAKRWNATVEILCRARFPFGCFAQNRLAIFEGDFPVEGEFWGTYTRGRFAPQYLYGMAGLCALKAQGVNKLLCMARDEAEAGARPAGAGGAARPGRNQLVEHESGADARRGGQGHGGGRAGAEAGHRACARDGSGRLRQRCEHAVVCGGERGHGERQRAGARGSQIPHPQQ